MKKLLILTLSVLISGTTMALTIDSLRVAGNVTNIVNGSPIIHKTVQIDIDSSSGWGATIGQSTDSSGNYDVRIPVNGPSGYIRIYLCDCNNVRHSVTRYYNLGGTPDSVYQNFYICDSSSCHANYSYTPDPFDLEYIQFHDLSTGSIQVWFWDFGDPASGPNNNSTDRNASHYFSSPGNYNVCLTIYGCASLCHDTYCENIQVDSIPVPCQAAFTVTHDSLNDNLTYSFHDQSTGNIAYWGWSFGDGQYSALQNPVHTYAHPGIYGVELHIQSADSSCNAFHYDTLYVGNGSGCQANFYFYSDSTGSDHIVHFFDISTGNPTQWMWNFGDPASDSSNVSTQQNAVHTFSSPGNYTVCLSISGDSCSSSFCRNVVIPDSVSYHQIYGQVFSGNFPLQLGLALIFSLDTSQNSVPYVNVNTIDSNGVYYFTQVPDGNYVINAIPTVSDGYLPTYFGDVITWEQANHITLGVPNNPYNIHLVPAGAMVPGQGSASGQINTGKTAISLIDKITMTLLDINKTPISFSRVSTTGRFDFPSLDYGTYYLHPELAGITSDTIMIEITPTKPHADVIMTFTGSKILGTGDIKTRKETVSIYPNPVTEQLTLAITLKGSTIILIDVCTVAGQVIYTTSRHVNEGQSTVNLPFSGLNEGMYIIKIYSEDGINIIKRVIKSR